MYDCMAVCMRAYAAGMSIYIQIHSTVVSFVVVVFFFSFSFRNTKEIKYDFAAFNER